MRRVRWRKMTAAEGRDRVYGGGDRESRERVVDRREEERVTFTIAVFGFGVFEELKKPEVGTVGDGWSFDFKPLQ